MSLYLLDRYVLDISRRKENREDFARLIAEYGKSLGDNGTFREVGVWLLIGMTGRWPLCIALWELGEGWDTFSDMVMKSMKAPDPVLAALYRNLQNMRLGAESFIMGAVPPTPPFDAMVKAADGKANLVIYEEAMVPPGKEEIYLAALAGEWVPVRARHGATLLGSFRLPKAEGRVVTMWTTDIAGHAAMAKADDSKWRKHAQTLRTAWREEVWIAGPESRFDPTSAAVARGARIE